MRALIAHPVVPTTESLVIMPEHVKIEINAGVATITLDRPEKRNALRREIIQRLLECVREAAGNESVRLLIIKAVGKVFCAGMDLGQMQERAESENSGEEWKIDSQVYCDLLTALVQIQIPTVACLQGPALAGGVGLVLACDIVIASENTFFMLPEPMRGITAAMVTPLLLHRIGAGPATYMLLSNERIPASRSYGICHAVVPPADLDTRLQALQESIMSGSKSAFAITKSHISASTGCDLATQLQDSMSVSAQARATPDAREGLSAFLEKRQPSWQTS